MEAQDKKVNILGLVGSLRKGSYNKMLMRAFKENMPENATLEVAEISHLPLYDQDMEESFPASAQELKNKIEKADAVLIATPEYNRAIPAPLKNVLDWTSRPYASTTWSGKKVLVVGASVGNIGTALAQYNLKQILNYLNARVIGQPEFYLSAAQDKFDSEGKLTDEKTKEHIVKAISVLLQ